VGNGEWGMGNGEWGVLLRDMLRRINGTKVRPGFIFVRDIPTLKAYHAL